MKLAMMAFLLPPAYVVRREGNVLTGVCPSVCPQEGEGQVQGTHPPARSDGGGGIPRYLTPFTGQDRGVKVPNPLPPRQGLATQLAVCLLRSRWRTFLYYREFLKNSAEGIYHTHWMCPTSRSDSRNPSNTDKLMMLTSVIRLRAKWQIFILMRSGHPAIMPNVAVMSYLVRWNRSHIDKEIPWSTFQVS